MNEPAYYVRGVPMDGTPQEYAAARMKPGQPVRFRTRHQSGVGILKGVSFFDGLVATVEVGTGATVTVILDTDEFEACEASELSATGMWGDGI